VFCAIFGTFPLRVISVVTVSACDFDIVQKEQKLPRAIFCNHPNAFGAARRVRGLSLKCELVDRSPRQPASHRLGGELIPLCISGQFDSHISGEFFAASN
jgi:hypothetical protein